jgi:HEAT repeat protein
VDGSKDVTNQDSSAGSDHAQSTAIRSLIADLASQDELVRTEARQTLVGMREPAVFPLIQALRNPRRQVRWEAAKSLSEIANPTAAPALVKALRDPEFSVRWLAAEGLIALGPKGLAPLLRALIERSDSVWVRQGGHHVLHDLAKGELKETLQSVVAALQGLEPSLEVPRAARAALDALPAATRVRSAAR